jgi:hypothetical protein
MTIGIVAGISSEVPVLLSEGREYLWVSVARELEPDRDTGRVFFPFCGEILLT